MEVSQVTVYDSRHEDEVSQLSHTLVKRVTVTLHVTVRLLREYVNSGVME